MKKLYYLCLLICSLNVFAGEVLFSLNEDNLDQDKIDNAKNLLHKTNILLPESLKNIVKSSGKIKVTFSDLSTIHGKSEANVLGYIEGKLSIVVSDKYLTDKSAEAKAIKVIIHESTHVFDNAKQFIGKEKRMRAKCNIDSIFPTDTESIDQLSSFCKRLLPRRYSVSDSDLFLDLAGFSQGIFSQKQENKNMERSPDVYEKTSGSSKEYFAVNMEYFLTDQEYRCRRPLLYRYFADVFNHQPFSDFVCRAFNQVDSDGGGKFILDPSRIFQIHYLFAGEGKEMGSQWGHAMFRIIMCRPGRKVGPDCMNDLSYHPVISFRANVKDIKTSIVGGIKGKYDSRLFILSMKDVLDEYVKGELREVQSIPLKFNQGQIEFFVNQVLEFYYGYVGTYYFFSNNCASESLKFIKNAGYETYEDNIGGISTPKGLKQALARMKISDESVFVNKESAIKGGFLYPSSVNSLSDSFFNLKKLLNIKYSNVDEFIKKSTSHERLGFIKKIQTMDIENRQAYLAKLYIIEDYILSHTSYQASNTILNSLLEHPEGNIGNRKTIYEDILLIQSLSKKYQFQKINKGYGIPQMDDLVYSEDQDINKKERDEFSSKKAAMEKKIRNEFKSEFFEVDETQKNLSLLLESMFSS